MVDIFSILGEKRKASIKAIVPTEIIEIKKNALEAILLSSNIELHKVINEMSKELGKEENQNVSFSKKNLTSLKVGIICFSTASFPAFFNESTVCLSKDLGRFKKGESQILLFKEKGKDTDWNMFNFNYSRL